MYCRVPRCLLLAQIAQGPVPIHVKELVKGVAKAVVLAVVRGVAVKPHMALANHHRNAILAVAHMC